MFFTPLPVEGDTCRAGVLIPADLGQSLFFPGSVARCGDFLLENVVCPSPLSQGGGESLLVRGETGKLPPRWK